MSENVVKLRKYFKADQYIVSEPDPGEINVSPIDKPSFNCLELELLGDTLKVEYIRKCSGASGTQLLNMISNFAKKEGLTYVTLDDKSRIEGICPDYKIPLYLIYILSTGKSWYNAYGYISRNYRREVANNSQYLDMKMHTFIRLCNSRTPVVRYRHTQVSGPMEKEELEDWIFGFNEAMNISHFYKNPNNKSRKRLNASMTVQETFTRIKKYILKHQGVVSSDEDEFFCDMLKGLLEMIIASGVIQYDGELGWNTSREFSGKKHSHKFSSSARKVLRKGNTSKIKSRKTKRSSMKRHATY